MGSISERGLLRHAIDDPALLAAEIVDVMEAPFPAVSAGDAVREAVELLADRPPGAARDQDGRAAGILTRADLLEARSVPMSSRVPAHAHGNPRGPRGPRARPELRLGHPADPSDLHLRAARPGEFVEDYDYARSANPTRAALEHALGELEGGHATGVLVRHGGTHALLTAHCNARRPRRVSRRPLRRHLPARGQGAARFGLDYDMVDQTDLDALRAAVRPETKLIWVETPTNPR